MARIDLTAQRLREILEYDPITGIFRWRISPKIGIRAGDIAGNVSKRWGYVSIKIKGVSHKAHRLAYLYMVGEWPPGDIDHRDRNRADNVWDNLRPATRGLNMQNQSGTGRSNSSGFLGVTWDAQRRKWRALIAVNKVQHRLGRFDTAEEAHAAYVAAKRRLHPGCTI